MRNRRIVVVSVFAVWAVGVVCALTPPAFGVPLPVNGRIYFEKSGARGAEKLVSVLPDGSDPVVSFTGTDFWGLGYRVALSPDASRLLLAQSHSSRGGSRYRSRLVIVDTADGGNLSVVFPAKDTFYASVDWSPDGLSLLFTRMSMRPGHSGYHLYSSGIDGSSLTRMAKGQMIDAAMSPDGSTIAFRDGQERLGVYDVATKTQTLLMDKGRSFDPEWSPDGTQIAFSWQRPNEPNADLYTISPDGASRTRLTTTKGVWESWPSWSPDGLQIVVTVDGWRTNLHDLSIVAADGSGSTALTDDRAYEFFPMWAAA